jgi:secreted trypsin-like serine protease
MKTVKYIGSSAFFFLASCGSPHFQEIQSRPHSNLELGIIGGVSVDPSDLINKYTVGIETTSAKYGKATCTGVLITENIVLTAAHCLVDIDHAIVVFGTDMKKAIKAKQFANVIAEVTHPEFVLGAEKDSHDIALIRFQGQKPSTYKTALLLSASQNLTKNMSVTLAGFGALSERRGKVSGGSILRKTTVPLMDPEFSKYEMAFSSVAGKGPCYGDSGGPAYKMINEALTVIGISSRTTDELGGCHKDSIYTKVSAYQDFIRDSIVRLQFEPARQD